METQATTELQLKTHSFRGLLCRGFPRVFHGDTQASLSVCDSSSLTWIMLECKSQLPHVTIEEESLVSSLGSCPCALTQEGIRGVDGAGSSFSWLDEWWAFIVHRVHPDSSSITLPSFHPVPGVTPIPFQVTPPQFHRVQLSLAIILFHLQNI